jgi:hypothetical protein
MLLSANLSHRSALSAGLQLWNALLLVWTLYQLVGVTFRIAFFADLSANETTLAIWFIVDWALDVLPIADVVLRAGVAESNHGVATRK